jgi:hypothetical protein
MTIRVFLRVLASWKLTIDSGRLLEFIADRSLEAQDWYKRFIRFTPELLDTVRAGGLSSDAQCAVFSRAVSWFRFGNIFKLTSRDRTLLADGAVLSLAREKSAPALLEIGSSDGISSLAFFEERGLFSEIRLTDRYNVFYRERRGFSTRYYDADKTAMYLRIGLLSFDLRPLGIKPVGDLERIETVNPLLTRTFGVERIERFDMFGDAADSRYDIIKCCNLLNKSYFSDDQIVKAVRNMARSLEDEGSIVVSQNHEKYDGGEAMFVLRKDGDVLTVVESVNDHDAVTLFC